MARADTLFLLSIMRPKGTYLYKYFHIETDVVHLISHLFNITSNSRGTRRLMSLCGVMRTDEQLVVGGFMLSHHPYIF